MNVIEFLKRRRDRKKFVNQFLEPQRVLFENEKGEIYGQTIIYKKGFRKWKQDRDTTKWIRNILNDKED